jgi:RNase P subunit RPR2
MAQPNQPSTNLNEIKRPLCSKCIRPMDWHSVETVQAYYGPKSIQVFECESCGRLTSVEQRKQNTTQELI